MNDRDDTPGGQTPDESTETSRIDAERTDPSPRAYSQMGNNPPTGRPPTKAFEDPGETTGLPPAGAPIDDFTPIPGDMPPGRAPGSGPVVSSPARRGRGRMLVGIAAAAVLLLVIGAVGSELYFRNKTKDCMQDAFSTLTGAPASVSLSGKPMLLQRIGGEVPYVQIDTDDSSGNNIRLHARADGITGLGDSPTVRSLNGSGFAPFDRVVAMSKDAMGSAANGNQEPSNPDGGGLLSGLAQGATVESVTGDAAAGTITIDSTVQVAILPVPVSTTIKPVLDNGKVRFDVVDAQAFIFGLPKDFAQTIVDNASKTMFGNLLDEVTVTQVKVTDSGIDFAFTGTDVNVGSQAGGSGKCSGL